MLIGLIFTCILFAIGILRVLEKGKHIIAGFNLMSEQSKNKIRSKVNTKSLSKYIGWIVIILACELLLCSLFVDSVIFTYCFFAVIVTLVIAAMVLTLNPRIWKT